MHIQWTMQWLLTLLVLIELHGGFFLSSCIPRYLIYLGWRVGEDKRRVGERERGGVERLS